MNTEHDLDVDVLVVGAGPSGLTLSAALARAGVRALTIDRHSGTSIFPKATGVRLRTMEILRSWGLDGRMPERDTGLRLVLSVSPTLAAPQLEEVSLGVPDDDGTFEITPSHFVFVAQDRLEPILLDHARERGGDVRFRTELVSLAVDDEGGTAQVRTVPDGPTYAVRARYIVGADGGGSTVRDAAGIAWSTLGSEGHHLSILFRADLSPALRGRSAVLHATVGPGAEGMFVATGEPDRWIFDVEASPDAGAVAAEWTHERVRDRLRRASGLADLEPRVDGTFPWEFGAAVADTQHAGPVFLIGDAAHRTTPRRATGMNTGIADAHNLGWKLAWVLRGWADPSLLDSYDAERRPVGVANARRSLESAVDDDGAREIMADDLGVVYRSAVIAPPGVAEAATEGSVRAALAGGRAPHAWVARDGRRTSLLDLYDGHLTVVAGAGGSSWRAAAADLAASGLPIQVVQLDTDVVDPDGTATARYGVATTNAVLVRPDGHVAACLQGPPHRSDALLRDAVARALGRSVRTDVTAIAG